MTYLFLPRKRHIQLEQPFEAPCHPVRSPCLVEFVQQFKVKAKLVVSILHKQQLWGILVAHRCSGPRHWQQLEIELLTHLATQAAIAIQQSELYQQLLIAVTVDSLTQIANRHQAKDQGRDQVIVKTISPNPL
ncbi:GAF domain-containing protein [Chroococcidiopsis sp. CCMEE 29]|uniref:GAF domain-containing protein n=1 Tax=Chroococcidiopsis sp. CCMEE 29 TaxID=155894 RepID=UPI0020223FE8|nr:GAF domain-containing protein [Chroococcidiopsis sp. CCMEE 29]